MNAPARECHGRNCPSANDNGLEQEGNRHKGATVDIPDEFKNPAEIAALLMRKPNVTRADREAAAKALLEGYETRLKARLISGRRISEADAEDLISDVIMKFMANPPQKTP